MIQIITPYDTFKHYNQPIEEFLKRLWKTVMLTKIKPSKKSNITQLIDQETKLICDILKKQNSYTLLLYIDSKTYSTQQFYEYIENIHMNHGNITFVIWWAYWVNESMIQQYIDAKISLSPMTFPHSQAIMMLLEQLYRISTIKKQTGYHH